MPACVLGGDGVTCVFCGMAGQRRRCLCLPAQEGERCLAGTSLKSLLSTVGITAAPNCPCQRHAAEMDAQGCDWCEENIETIVGWLRDEATKRGLPFLDAAGRLLVRRAIHNARKAAKEDKLN